mmetsp:Transcript_37482/g.94717  ORF Transcript_37482/g.94717 Transcript_37482/m.94717 type:complete len:324 (+) Transcript_37482:1200-2171(+)
MWQGTSRCGRTFWRTWNWRTRMVKGTKGARAAPPRPRHRPRPVRHTARGRRRVCAPRWRTATSPSPTSFTSTCRTARRRSGRCAWRPLTLPTHRPRARSAPPRLAGCTAWRRGWRGLQRKRRASTRRAQPPPAAAAARRPSRRSSTATPFTFSASLTATAARPLPSTAPSGCTRTSWPRCGSDLTAAAAVAGTGKAAPRWCASCPPAHGRVWMCWRCPWRAWLTAAPSRPSPRRRPPSPLQPRRQAQMPSPPHLRTRVPSTGTTSRASPLWATWRTHSPPPLSAPTRSFAPQTARIMSAPPPSARLSAVASSASQTAETLAPC